MISPTGNEFLYLLLPVLTSSTLLSVNHQGQAPAATFHLIYCLVYALGDAVNKLMQDVDK